MQWTANISNCPAILLYGSLEHFYITSKGAKYEFAFVPFGYISITIDVNIVNVVVGTVWLGVQTRECPETIEEVANGNIGAY